MNQIREISKLKKKKTFLYLKIISKYHRGQCVQVQVNTITTQKVK